MDIRANEIVVGIDGSDSSVSALRWAKKLGEGMHLDVHVVIDAVAIDLVLLGSVSSACAEQARCPVLVVPDHPGA